MANEQYLDSDGLNQFWKSAKKEILNEVDSALGKVCTISISANDDALGTVSGGGSASIGTEIVLSADAKTNADFVGWKENGEIVSVDNRYKFTVEKDRALVGEFTQRINGLGSKWKYKTLSMEDALWNGVYEPQSSQYVMVNSSSSDNVVFRIFSHYDTPEGIGTLSKELAKFNPVCGNGKILFSSGEGMLSSYGPYNYSYDGGISWEGGYVTPVNSDYSGLKLYRMYFLNNKFYAVFKDERNSNYTRLYSADPELQLSWKEGPLLSMGFVNVEYRLAYGNGKYIAVYGNNTDSRSVLYSYDAINWHRISGTFSTSIGTVRYFDFDGDKFYVYGSSTSGKNCRYSYDGLNWFDNLVTPVNMISIINIPGLYIGGITAGSSTIYIYRSYDGFVWFLADEGILNVSSNIRKFIYNGKDEIIGLPNVATSNLLYYSSTS